MLDPFLSMVREGGLNFLTNFTLLVLAMHIFFGKLLRLIQLGHARTSANRALTATPVDGQIRCGFPAFDSFVRSLRVLHPKPLQVEYAYEKLMAELSPVINRGVSTIATVAITAPLIGLFGTISGVNQMFDVIGRFGFGSPTIMARSIALSLRATFTGLVVGVVAILCLDFIKTLKQKLIFSLRHDRDQMMRTALAGHPHGEKNYKGGAMRARHNPLEEDHQNPEVNLAPMIDTIMVLLIFFVVTANLYVETGVDVSKPKAQSATAAGQKAMLIGVTREGTVHVYGRQVSIDRLRMLVEQEVEKAPETSVVIISDRDGAVGRTVEVIDQCTLAGARNISIAAGKD